MILSAKAPAVLATTALLILRNQLSERVWGSHGVNTLRVDGPQPHRPGTLGLATKHLGLGRFTGIAASPHRDDHPCPPPSIVPSDHLTGIGVIGDSISDEYRFYAPDRATARNWVEILAAARGLPFGDPSVVAGRVNKDRRFAYNWSQSGATTTSLMSQGQHTGLAAQVQGGAPINLATVSIGTNDFADVLIRSRSVVDMLRVLERASANLAAVLDALLGINKALKIAVFSAVDLRSCPLLRGALNSGLLIPRLADAYSDAVAAFNNRLLDLIAAERQRVVLIDINQLLAEVTAARPFVVGDLEIDCSVASNEPPHLFLADGFHPGTIGQCLIANRFLAAINARFGTGIPLLSGAEMVRIAASVPKPSGLSLFGTGVLALFGYGRRRPRAA